MSALGDLEEAIAKAAADHGFRLVAATWKRSNDRPTVLTAKLVDEGAQLSLLEGDP